WGGGGGVVWWTARARPRRRGQGGGGLDVEQRGGDHRVGGAPQPPAERAARLGDEQRHEGGGVEVADHRRWSATRSLTVPVAGTGCGAARLRRVAGRTRPSATNRSSVVGDSTGTIRAIARP